jgi:RNA polymerase sigma-70 factor (ECF subfamily)
LTEVPQDVAVRGKVDAEVARMIERLARGDPDAWTEFIERYRRLIFGAIHRVNERFGAGWDETAMEEVFEEVLWKLLRRQGRALASWKGDCKLETWIYRIVRNACIDRLRSAARRGESAGPPEGGAEAGAASGAAAADLRISLEQAIERALSPREAVAIRLIYFEGLTYREVAERFGVSVGAMSGFVFRALKKLKRDGGLPAPANGG